MRTFISVVVFVVLSVTTGFSQTRLREIDPAVLQMGLVDVRPIDADGNSQTEEWLVYGLHTLQFRVIAVNPTGVCLGEIFTVPSVTSSESFELVQLQSRDVLKVKRATSLFSYVFEFIALTRPTC